MKKLRYIFAILCLMASVASFGVDPEIKAFAKAIRDSNIQKIKDCLLQGCNPLSKGERGNVILLMATHKKSSRVMLPLLNEVINYGEEIAAIDLLEEYAKTCSRSSSKYKETTIRLIVRSIKYLKGELTEANFLKFINFRLKKKAAREKAVRQGAPTLVSIPAPVVNVSPVTIMDIDYFEDLAAELPESKFWTVGLRK